MTTQLSLYNGSLREIGARQLGSLTEQRKSRRLLDGVWADNAVRACLEAGSWDFATRAMRIDYDTNITPNFGFQCIFELPADFVNIAEVSTSEYFTPDSIFTSYSIESGYFCSDLETVYIKYISDDPNYGFNFSLWSPAFIRYVEVYLASRIVKAVTSSDSETDRVMNLLSIMRKSALGKTAMKRPATRLPTGRLASARHNGSSSRRIDRAGW